jgi:hypothetical protein
LKLQRPGSIGSPENSFLFIFCCDKLLFQKVQMPCKMVMVIVITFSVLFQFVPCVMVASPANSLPSPAITIACNSYLIRL